MAIFQTKCWFRDNTRGHRNPFAKKNRYERAYTVLYFKYGSQMEIVAFLQLLIKNFRIFKICFRAFWICWYYLTLWCFLDLNSHGFLIKCLNDLARVLQKRYVIRPIPLKSDLLIIYCYRFQISTSATFFGDNKSWNMKSEKTATRHVFQYDGHPEKREIREKLPKWVNCV